MYFVPAWMFASACLMSPTLSSAPCRHDLHDADRAYRTLHVLVQCRFLVTLRGEHHGVEVVLVAVLLKMRDQPLKAPSCPCTAARCIDG